MDVSLILEVSTRFDSRKKSCVFILSVEIFPGWAVHHPKAPNWLWRKKSTYPFLESRSLIFVTNFIRRTEFTILVEALTFRFVYQPFYVIRQFASPV